MTDHTLRLTEDEALVLQALFHRFDETERVSFEHPGELVAMWSLAAQIEKTTAAVFSPDYQRLLDAARRRLAEGQEDVLRGTND